MSYATLLQLKQYLKFQSPETVHAEDGLLQSFLDEATTLIDDVTGFPSAAASATSRTFNSCETVTPYGVLFGGDCVNGITSVTYNNGTVLSPTAYRTEPAAVGPYWGLTLLPGTSAWGWAVTAGVVVTGYWAYTTKADGTADALIVGACRTLAAWLYREKDNVGTLASSGDGVTVVSAALPSNVFSRLMNRRRL